MEGFEMWIAPIAALIGTVIGATTPILTEFVKNNTTRSHFKKDKYEHFTRVMLNEFLPKVEMAIFSIDATMILFKDDINLQNSHRISLKKDLQEAMDLFDEKIKDVYPLEIIKEVEKLAANLRHAIFYIGPERSEDSSMNEFQDKMLKNINRGLKYAVRKTKKKLEKNYI